MRNQLEVPVSAILFPHQEGAFVFRRSFFFLKKKSAYLDRPRIITVNCQSSSGCQTPLIQSHFPGLSQSMLIKRGSKGERLNMPLQLWYAPSASQNRSPVNAAVYNITFGRVWYGPFIALKFTNTQRRDYTGIGNNDLDTLVAFFLTCT